MRLFLMLVSLLLALSLPAHETVPLHSLNDGDLLFVVTPQGNAITQVTQGVQQLPVDHVAIFHWRTTDSIATVIQAIGKGVVMEPLDSLYSESGPSSFLLVGRLNCDFDTTASLTRAMTYLGHPYDYYYEPSDSAIYCSELVLKSYVGQRGNFIFQPIPMTFRDSRGVVPEYWTRHYARRGLKVPEDEPGSNPGELSRRPCVSLLGRLTSAGK